MAFKYPLKAKATLIDSGETGMIIGRGEYVESKPSYLIRYQARTGSLVEQWWPESAIASVELPPKGPVRASFQKPVEEPKPAALPGLPGVA